MKILCTTSSTGRYKLITYDDKGNRDKEYFYETIQEMKEDYIYFSGICRNRPTAYEWNGGKYNRMLSMYWDRMPGY